MRKSPTWVQLAWENLLLSLIRVNSWQWKFIWIACDQLEKLREQSKVINKFRELNLTFRKV